jgi:site-specific DNA-methyltransferase (adenine-specific)
VDINRVVQGDALELLRTVPNNFANLIIADPPYNIGKDFGIGQVFKNVDLWRRWCRQWLAECNRILAENGALFVYGIHQYICHLQVDLMDIGMEYGRLFIWHYENGFAGYTKKPAAHYEPILWMTKSKDFVYHPIREPYKSKERLKHKVTKNGKVWTPHPEGRLAGDVWRFPTLAGRRFADERVEHPTQKPLNLTLRIVKHFSNAGDIVLAPFVGSGTECVASKMLNRNYIGFELNPAYIAIAEARLANTQTQHSGDSVIQKKHHQLYLFEERETNGDSCHEKQTILQLSTPNE